MAFDLFISHSGRDDFGGRITKLIEGLNREFKKIHGRKLKVFFDTAARFGRRRRILSALRDSRLFLACLTPAYLQSRRCEWELSEYLKHETTRGLTGEGISVVQFSDIHHWRETKLDHVFPKSFAELRRRNLFDLRDGSEHEKSLHRLAVQTAHLVRLIERSEDSPGDVGPFNPHFVGRHDELQQIHEALASEALCVLNGPRGIGKTAIATEYAHAFAREYGGGRWHVSSQERKSLPEAIETLAPVLELSLRSKFPAVLRELHKRTIATESKRCLLILDDLAEPRLLADRHVERLLAKNADWLHVIVTTQLEIQNFGPTVGRRLFLTIDYLPEQDLFRLIGSLQPALKLALIHPETLRRILTTLEGLSLPVYDTATSGHSDSLLIPEAGEVYDWKYGMLDHLRISKKDDFETTAKAIPSPLPLDENVMFTVYRRKTVAPNKWYPLLAFAHLSERRPDAPPDEPDPGLEVQRQVQALFGNAIADFKASTEDSSQAIPRSGELMFKPSVPGIEFNPPSRTFKWEEAVHREEFKMRANSELEGQSARGCLRVFLGPIIVAEVNLVFKVDSNAGAADIALEIKDNARPFRKVFASYSHKDTAIVEHIEKLAHDTHLGLEYLRDVTKLRSGEVWNESLLQMIDTADLFQLFWSTNSMCSEFVKREYEHALARQLPDFVRPVYWEKPFPERPADGLPPEALRRLHFEALSIAGAVHLPEQMRVNVEKHRLGYGASRMVVDALKRLTRRVELEDEDSRVHNIRRPPTGIKERLQARFLPIGSLATIMLIGCSIISLIVFIIKWILG